METEEILIQLRKLIRALNLESKKIEKDHGVSIPQLLTLRFVASQKDYQATHTEIKKFLNLNPSTVTGIIQRLEKKAMIAGINHPTDKRITLWTLSAKGISLLQNMPPLLHDLLTIKLEKLKTSERKEILINLKKLVSLLELNNVEASPFFIPNDTLT